MLQLKGKIVVTRVWSVTNEKLTHTLNFIQNSEIIIVALQRVNIIRQI